MKSKVFKSNNGLTSCSSMESSQAGFRNSKRENPQLFLEKIRSFLLPILFLVLGTVAQAQTSVIASTNQINIGGLAKGTTQVISQFLITQTVSTKTLTQVADVSTGTFTSADITNVKLYGGTSTDFAAATLLSTLTPSAASTLTFSGLTYTIAVGANYFWITADISSSATTGRTLALSAIAPAGITITGVTPTGSVTAAPSAGTFAVTPATPSFTTGNIIGLVAANTSGNSAAAIVEVNTTTAGQTPSVYTVGTPTGANSIRISGSGSSTGYLANSNDGSLLSFTAHGSSVSGSGTNVTALQTGKSVVTYNALGALSIPTTYNGTGTNQARGASSLNNSTWYIGDQGGFYSNGTSAASPSGNIRSVKAFGGTMYAFTSSATAPTVGIISAATGGTYTALTGLPNGTTSMQDFSMVSSASNGTYDVLYILEATGATVGTIYKYSLVSGTWTANGTYSTAIGGFGLLAEKSGTGANLYMSTGTGATAANKINKLVDGAGYNTTISITGPTTLYTAPAGSTIKGVAFSPASPSIAISAAHPVASNVNQGSADNIIGGIACAVTTSTATLNAITVNTAGTYSASDLTNIKFWYNTSNTLVGATQLGSTQAAIASGASVGVSGLTQTIAAGTTGYILVTASISGSATLANTISLASTAFSNITFAIGTKTGTDPVAAGNNQTISQVTPTIALANGTIGAANINQNTTNNVLYRADFTVGAANASLTSAAFTTSGTYNAADITNLKLWYSTSATFSTGTATLIATKTTGLGAGLQTFSSLSQTISTIGTGYLYVTTDVPCFATINATISVNAVTTGDFTFTLGSATGSGFTAGGTQTIIAGTTTPSNVATNTSVGNGTASQINAAWTAPTGCYDEIMVVASPLANTGGTPTGDGSAYTASLAYTSGTAFGNGYVMYKGTTSPQTLTGFTNGTTYFIKIFTRYNTTWSTGTEVSAKAYTTTALTEVVVPQYIQGKDVTNTNRVPSAYCVTLSGLTPNATYRYNNQAVISTDSATSAGAGNIIYVGTTQSANFVETAAPTLTTAGTYGTFTANSSGNYTGWFITEPTGNATRFTPGTQVFFRILLNDGNNGTLVDRIATTASSSTVINLVNAAAATNGTAIRGTSSANAKDFVCLYDNTTGTGRPLAATYIEDDGNATVASFATFITSSVNGVAGAWGTIIPNTLANGVRRIETRAFTTGNVICSVSDADGVWSTGSINTVNPAGGTTAIVIANTDAALNCSSIVLDHTGIAQTTASTENLNTNDNIISNFRVNTSTYSTSLNAISFPIGGTFVAGNVANFKLYTSTSPSFPGGTALSTVVATSIASGDTVTFSSLAQANAVGDRYFWITADFGLTGTGNTIIVPALLNANFSFASNATITTNSITTGGVVTLGVVDPTIVVSSSTITAANINDGTTNNVLYRANVAVSVTSASLNAISFTTTGTYVPADVTNFKLWYSTNATFATGTSTLLATKTTSLDAGLQAFTGLAQTIPSGTTGYFYLTTDLPCSTTTGNAISVNAIAASDLTFAQGTPTGSGTATATQTISISTPGNVTGVTATATGVSQQVSIAFTLPATCYDEIMIVAATAANTAAPTGNGSGYTASLTYGSGTAIGNGSVVYKGTASPQLVIGLTNGTPYFFKIFTRNGTLWSVGSTDVTATPVALPALTEVLLPQYIQGNSSTNNTRIPYSFRATLYNLLPSATYRYFNQVVINSDAPTTTGAGNAVFANAGGFTSSSSPSLATAGGYSTFTTDATGSYTGWFIAEPTGNVRFTPGNTVNMRIMLNNGSTGTTVATRLTTTSGVSVINFGATASDATGIRGTSYGTAKNFVMLYDNTAGTGRPISGTYLESDGSATSSYATFYTSSVNTVTGAWGTIIPNTLTNGIRKIQEYAFSSGNAIGLTATSSNGIWPSTVNTANPTSGVTALVINTTDAPLEDIPTSSILTGSTAVCAGSSADLSIAITGGTSPYTVVYNDGTSNITLNGYVSDAAITVTPTSTKTYTLVSVTDAAGFVGVGTSGSAIVTVNPLPTATISVDNNSQCINQTAPIITFTGANGSGTVRYRFYYTINSGPVLSTTSALGASTATLSVSSSTVKTANYTLVSVEDVNTTCSQNQTGTITVSISLCTNIRPLLCGKTLTNLTTAIQASPIPGATKYEFEITSQDGSITPYVTSIYYFSLFKTPGLALYGKTYSMRVRAYVGGSWTAWGKTCTVSTPVYPLTKLYSPSNSSVVKSLSFTVIANPVTLSTKYRFRVFDGSTTRIVETNINHFFKSTSLPGGFINNTLYTVDVATFYNGTWSAYGPTSTFSTPATPLAKMSNNNTSTKDIFDVKAFPNPFASHFSLDIESSSDDLVAIKVYDMIGRQLESHKASISELSTQKIGNNYPSGVYNIIVTQGEKVKSIRMIKR